MDKGSAGAFAVEWKELELWDALTAKLLGEPKPAYPLFALGDIAAVRFEKVPGAEIASGIVRLLDRVSFDGEVFPSASRNTKMTQYRASPGDLVISKIRARQGSIGLVSDQHGNLGVSIHYRALIPDSSKVETYFLWLLLRSGYCRRQFLSATGGAMKGEISEASLLALRIPLPALATQRAIVARWQKTQADIAATRARADDLEGKARAVFLAGLGLREPAALAVRKAFALDSARVDRWGVAQVRESLAAPDLAAGKFPVVRLREVIANLENGWSPKCHPRPATIEEWGVLKLGAVSYGTFDETANKALPKNFQPRSDLEIRAGDVLFVRGNVLSLVGACAHVERTRSKLMMPDLIFRAVFRADSPVIPAYLAEVMRTTHLRRQIKDVATGTSPTMKKVTKPALLALRLPLPPLAVQKSLVAAVAAARAEAARERAGADQLAASAATTLETSLLGTSEAT